jgi:hypothetical protein
VHDWTMPATPAPTTMQNLCSSGIESLEAIIKSQKPLKIQQKHKRYLKAKARCWNLLLSLSGNNSSTQVAIPLSAKKRDSEDVSCVAN